MFHERLMREAYMMSRNENDGDMLMYLNSWKVASIGTRCCMPLRQSFIRFDLKSRFSLVVMEFDICPVYDIEIFSYHRSFPA